MCFLCVRDRRARGECVVYEPYVAGISVMYPFYPIVEVLQLVKLDI